MDEEALALLKAIDEKLDRILAVVENPIPGLDVEALITQALDLTRKALPGANQIESTPGRRS